MNRAQQIHEIIREENSIAITNPYRKEDEVKIRESRAQRRKRIRNRNKKK